MIDNSNSARASEKRKLEKISDENYIVEKKPSVTKRIGEAFFSESVGDLKHYLLHDTLIPMIKDGLYGLVRNSLDFLFYSDRSGSRGGSRRGSTVYGSSGKTYINYNSISKKEKEEPREVKSSRIVDLVVNNKAFAEDVLSELIDNLDECEFVTVGDLYDLAGKSTVPTDYDYGWTTLEGASINHTPDGYWEFKLPRARAIRGR